MSVGLGGVTAFLSLKLWNLVRLPGVRVQNLELKAAGRITRSGWVFASLSVLWLAFASHSAVAQWHRAWGRHYLGRTEVSRVDGLSGAFRAKSYTERHERASAEAFRHFLLADRWGLTGVIEVKLGLAWCYVLRGDLGMARREAGAAIALAPTQQELVQNLVDIERAAAPSTVERFALAEMLATSGKLEEAAVEFEACVASTPDSVPARFNLGGVLRRLGRNRPAIEQLETARRLAPEDPDVLVELGLAYMAAGENRQALEALERAVALDPDSPEAKLHLPELIRRLAGNS